jgi:hypothetical protein
VVCGGNPEDLFVEETGSPVKTNISTLREGLPPIGSLPEIDLLIQASLGEDPGTAHGVPGRRTPPAGRPHRGPVADPRVASADSGCFQTGETVNPEYQSLLTPRNASIRCGIVERIVSLLGDCDKAVEMEWCSGSKG